MINSIFLSLFSPESAENEQLNFPELTAGDVFRLAVFSNHPSTTQFLLYHFIQFKVI